MWLSRIAQDGKRPFFTMMFISPKRAFEDGECESEQMEETIQLRAEYVPESLARNVIPSLV